MVYSCVRPNEGSEELRNRSRGTREGLLLEVDPRSNCMKPSSLRTYTFTHVNKSKKLIPRNLNATMSEYNRDSFAKTIYSKLFDWLVSRVNSTLSKPYNQKKLGKPRVIGILDIFGFEIFEVNSFE